jgi:hypothetical protein
MTMKPEHMGASVARNNQYQAQWTSGRWLDPVRAAALHEAVNAMGYMPGWKDDEQEQADKFLRLAERFEAWLAGPDE